MDHPRQGVQSRGKSKLKGPRVGQVRVVGLSEEGGAEQGGVRVVGRGQALLSLVENESESYPQCDRRSLDGFKQRRKAKT